jgi:small subunit ribosomal protein S2
MYTKNINLTMYQLIQIGVYLGHNKKQSKFLCAWMFSTWRKGTFIINLVKTVQMFKIALRTVLHAAKKRRPIWYVSLHPQFGAMVAKYGYICGEAFNVYWWIDGSLTNFKSIVGWHELLLRLLNQDRYKLRHIDRKKLVGYIGLLTHRRRMPAAGFVPNVLESNNPSEEFTTCKIPNIGVVDSNVGSWNVLIPIAGNDDSVMCINYYCYMITRSILAGKINYVDNWRFGLIREDKKRLFIKRCLFTYLIRPEIFDHKVFLTDFMEFFADEVEPAPHIQIKNKVLVHSLISNVFGIWLPEYGLFHYVKHFKETMSIRN